MLKLLFESLYIYTTNPGCWCSVPRVSSVRWLLKLYSVVVAGLGLILSLSWTCFHLYVLSVTSLPELRQHRCCNTDHTLRV